MTKQIINAVTAVFFALCFAVTAMAEENCVPMARKGEIPNPSVLADNIEMSLQRNPSGNGRVEGAYISPNGFLKAMQGAGGTVTSVDFLPTYLRSLVQGPMPKRETYSRTCKDSADGEYYVDITKGFTREARLGEVGWYDTNTNYLILAGDCSNSPLRVVERPRPVQVAWRDLPKTESRPAFGPRTQMVRDTDFCPAPYSMLLVIYEERALRMHGKAGDVAYYAALQRIRHGEALESVRKGEDASVSALFGEEFAYLKHKGSLKLDPSTYTVSIVVINTANEEREIWNGEVTGFHQFFLPDWVTETDVVNVRFVHPGTRGEDGKFHVNMISPGQTGILKDVADMPRCRTETLSAIAGDYSLVAVELDKLRYPPEFISEAELFEDMVSYMDTTSVSSGVEFKDEAASE